MARHFQRLFYAHATRPLTGVTSSRDVWLAKLEYGIVRTVVSAPSSVQTQVADSSTHSDKEEPSTTRTVRETAVLEHYRSTSGYKYSKFKRMLSEWEAKGPPPFSEYKLTFGKHRGKRLEEVPDSYLVKYLIPRAQDVAYECPLVSDAIADFLKRHPDVKSQAGRARTEPLPEGIMQQTPTRKGRRKSSKPKHN